MLDDDNCSNSWLTWWCTNRNNTINKQSPALSLIYCHFPGATLIPAEIYQFLIAFDFCQLHLGLLPSFLPLTKNLCLGWRGEIKKEHFINLLPSFSANNTIYLPHLRVRTLKPFTGSNSDWAEVSTVCMCPRQRAIKIRDGVEKKNKQIDLAPVRLPHFSRARRVRRSIRPPTPIHCYFTQWDHLLNIRPYKLPVPSSQESRKLNFVVNLILICTTISTRLTRQGNG